MYYLLMSITASGGERTKIKLPRYLLIELCYVVWLLQYCVHNMYMYVCNPTLVLCTLLQYRVHTYTYICTPTIYDNPIELTFPSSIYLLPR